MGNELQLVTLCHRRHFLRFICIFKLVINIDCPIQLKDTFKLRFNIHQRNLRDKTLLDFPTVKSSMGQSGLTTSRAFFVGDVNIFGMRLLIQIRYFLVNNRSVFVLGLQNGVTVIWVPHVLCISYSYH